MNRSVQVFADYSVFLFSVLLVFVATFQWLGYSQDYYSYLDIFLHKIDGKFVPIEPFFYLLRFINIIFFPSTLNFIYFFTTCFSLCVKYLAIANVCKHYYNITFLCYICAFFLIHEYTQIRVSCAIGVFFLSLDDLIKKRSGKYFIKVVIATCFHYSAILMLLFYLYVKKINSRFLIVLFPVFGFVFSLIASTTILGEGMQSLIFILGKKLSLFNKLGNVSDFITPFNLKYLMLLITFVIHALKTSRNDYRNLILMKTVSFGLCCFYWLLPTELPVVFVRFAEFYTCTFVIYYFSNLVNWKNWSKKILFLSNFIVVILYSVATFRTTML